MVVELIYTKLMQIAYCLRIPKVSTPCMESRILKHLSNAPGVVGISFKGNGGQQNELKMFL